MVSGAIGTSLFRLGEVGRGNILKLLNNYVALTNQAALCEAMALADRLGIPRQTVGEVLGKSSGASFILERKLGAMIEQDYRAGFSCGHGRRPPVMVGPRGSTVSGKYGDHGPPGRVAYMASGRAAPFFPARARQSSMDRPWNAPLAQKLIRPSSCTVRMSEPVTWLRQASQRRHASS
jgi:hypothetical protein